MEKMSVNEAIVVKMMQNLSEALGGPLVTEGAILNDLRSAQANVKAALSLNDGGAANFLAKQRDADSTDVILRRTEMTTQGGLFA